MMREGVVASGIPLPSPCFFLAGHLPGREGQDPEAECRDTSAGKGHSGGEDTESSAQDRTGPGKGF